MRSKRWWWQWIVSPMLGAVALAVGPAVPALANGDARPRIHPEPRSFDLGELFAGDTAEATFRIQNRGNADLVIHEVRSSCGCTTAVLSDKDRTIVPGAVRTLVARFDSSKLLGLQRKTVTLTCNDPDEPRVTLILLADVVTLFRVEPGPLVNLRSARRGETLPPLDLFPTDPNQLLEDVAVDMPPGLFEYSFESIERGDGVAGTRLRLTVPADRDLGIVEAELLLRGNVGGEPAELAVRVTGAVVGDLAVHPVLLQSLRPTLRGRRFAPVFLSATHNRPFAIVAADAGPHLEVTIKPRADRKEYTLHTTLRDTAPDGPLAATLRIRTDNTGQPLIDLPIFVQVMPRFRIEPRMVLLGPHEGRNTRDVRIAAVPLLPIGIRAVTCDNAAVTCNVLDPDTRSGEAVIRVALADATDTPADFDATLTVVPDQPGATEIEIEVAYRHGAERAGAMTLNGSATRD